ncbi:MAG: CinA family protein [Propionibacteriaceae bacterium]|jgi:nicotinamide-nucleotide amidase|nr:CinA family protein [Propionibacteriaceae bacterium]
MPERVIAALAARGESLSTAESLTGGLLAAALTSVPGASQVYAGGVVAYQTPMKAALAGVPPQILDAGGPVCEATALALAAGIRARTGSTWALATTGVAGPDPQDGHEVGEVWIALAGPSGATAMRHDFAGDRQAIRTQTVAAALAALCDALP